METLSVFIELPAYKEILLEALGNYRSQLPRY
jgi:hypothetical protein